MWNKRRKLNLSIVLIAMALCMAGVACADPMGTAFTYQGWLMDKKQPADGLYDFEFLLYDANDLGTQIGSTITKGNVDVKDGFFAVSLDFVESEPNAFKGDARWLEIAVRPGASTDPCEYDTLSPRTELALSPYAFYSKTAGTDNDWMVSGNDMYSIPSGNVGVGTASPGTKFHIHEQSSSDVYLSVEASSSNAEAGIRLKNPAGGWDVFANNDDADFGIAHAESDRVVTINKTNGNVGIGTESPAAKLTVNGAILRSGSTMYGANSHTHINLGIDSKTGAIGPAIVNATVGGGNDNHATNDAATVSGGYYNTASGEFATVGGGGTNIAGNNHATVGGGQYNEATGRWSTIPGGFINSASADFSFAAGFKAKASHASTFVWADLSGADFESTGVGQFLIRASGGVGIGTTDPNAELHVVGNVIIEDGNQGDGKVLTSNASGVGTWQTPPGIPSGGIIMWSGTIANIPAGWALCDGTNGTPDLTSQFIRSVPNSSTDPGSTGGSATHTHSAGSYSAGGHSHSAPSGTHTHPFRAVVSNAGGIDPAWSETEPSAPGTGATGDTGGGTVSGTSGDGSSLPPYFELAFIMRTS